MAIGYKNHKSQILKFEMYQLMSIDYANRLKECILLLGLIEFRGICGLLSEKGRGEGAIFVW
jgi:hypothetical protein